MSLKTWEKKVLAKPGARERVAEIADELRLAAGLTAARERAEISQRELARRTGISQPRVAQIEKAENVTVDVLARYVSGLGGELEVSMRREGKRVPLLASKAKAAKTATPRSQGRAKTTKPRRASAGSAR